jgi:hypothetical protein
VLQRGKVGSSVVIFSLNVVKPSGLASIRLYVGLLC